VTLTGMQKAAYDAVDKMITSLEKELLTGYRATQTALKDEVGKFYLTYLTGIPAEDHKIVAQQYNRLKALNKKFQGTYMAFGSDTYRQLKDGQLEIFEDMYYRSQYTLSTFSDVTFNRLNPLVSEASVTGDIEVWKRIRDTALRDRVKQILPASGLTLKDMLTENFTEELVRIQRTVKQGLMNGVPFKKQAEGIEDMFVGFENNALRIVRTEGNRNANAADYYNTQQTGIPVTRQWVATLDTRTRDRHQALDGVNENSDGKFCIDGSCARYPGDFGVPALDINCRCSVINIIDGVAPTARRGRDPFTGETSIASYENYGEWKKRHDV